MTRLIHELVPDYIRELSPYVPGKPIEEVERELKTHAIKLASNENPLGPSPLAMEAAKKALANSNRYPDGSGFYLREALSKKHSIPAENIILGGGSTELIDLSARMVLRPGDCGVTSYGSFPLYHIAVRATGARFLEIPMRDYTFDLPAIARDLPVDTKLIFISNPNNPTGTMFTADDFDQFLNCVPEHILIVLDEAYCDYVDRPNYSRSIEIVRRGRNLLVLRTFSKSYGLAGLRIGYGVGQADFLNEMNKIRGPFNTSGVAQAAALAALDDKEHVRRSVESNRAGLVQLQAGLKKIGVRPVPSVTNFILIDFGFDADPLAAELMKHGVIVRPMRWMGFPNAIRVSIGTKAENEKFLQTLTELHAPTARKQEASSKRKNG
ncbi:MAG TPA: histidinol-phosphate transaminase [Candidatus Limnocylindria bacterium]|nr:histidinol-phosphate transaminase [Candidatus Limnocylindria bacterium]